MKNGAATKGSRDAAQGSVPHPEDNRETVASQPITGDMVAELVRSIQSKIDRALASRDRAEAARRIQQGIDVAEINR